jgi:hypothetical protein
MRGCKYVEGWLHWREREEERNNPPPGHFPGNDSLGILIATLFFRLTTRQQGNSDGGLRSFSRDQHVKM